MLVKPPMEKLLPRTENRYTLAILAAKRTRQLVAGACPMAESDTPNLVTMACEEIAANKVIEIHGEVEPVIPLRPDVEVARQTRLSEEEEETSLEALRNSIGVTEDDKEEAPEAPRSMIKILDAENEAVDAEVYFSEFDEENDEDADLQILTDLFSGEADRLAADAGLDDELEAVEEEAVDAADETDEEEV
ncbi:MAG TPA: DNA-directed RNA polymerase subunit omega [Clostridiaceae bacterium]|nr:DNA-directed RNA polymerase subunit omega [Clostridiaceae bacterium]